MNFKPCIRIFSLISIISLLLSCVSLPPKDVNHICSIFRQNPKWYIDAMDVEHRWRLPVPVLMAILHQESKFDAQAKPPRTKLLWFIPWKRPTTAYGYSQALDLTWKLYKKSANGGSLWASRTNFADAVDFVGWYVNQAHIRAGISREDAYSLYLAYHEGVGGYMHKSYLKKPWLVLVARKVRLRAYLFKSELNQCKPTLLKRHSWK